MLRVIKRTDTQTITVVDTTKPVLTLLGDNPQTIEFGEGYAELEATATDLVDDDTELTSKIVIAGDEVITNQLGTYDVTYDVTDTAGNAAEQKTRTVRVTDTTAPMITAPADVSKEAIGPTTPVTVGQATATDLAADSVTITRNPADNEFAVGVHIITWKATDASGNKETDTQTITVVDTTKPMITLTGANPQIIEFGEGYTELRATATDLVDDDTVLTDRIAINTDNVDTSAVGEYTVTYDVTDTAGNAAEQKTRTVRVIDNTKPMITLTGANPQTIEFGEGYTELNATAADLVDDDTVLTDRIAINTDNVDTSAVGEYTVTYDVTDTAGNAAEQKTRTVRVIDTGKPVITLTGANPQTIEFGEGYTELNATATDLVDDDTELTSKIVINTDNVDTSAVGEYTVTYNVTDTAGNAAEQKTRTVRVHRHRQADYHPDW